MLKSEYAYIWEYRVRLDSLSEFEKAYGPEGSWVGLFRQHPGYVRTELHRDVQSLGRYMTIDYWESKDACDAFRQRFAAEFEALDEQCERLTDDEIYLGAFTLL